MNKSITPILYDFRKVFLRPVTLMLLILFIVIGIGISYLVLSALSQQYPSTNIAAILVYSNGTCELHGYVYDVTGNPSNGELIVIDSKGNTIYGRYLDSGFSISDPGLCILFNEKNIGVQLKSSYGKYSVNMFPNPPTSVNIDNSGIGYTLLYTGDTGFEAPIPSIFISSMSNNNYMRNPIVLIPELYRLIILSRTSGEARLIFGAINITINTSNIVVTKPSVVIDYGFARFRVTQLGAGATLSELNTSSITFKRLGILGDSIIKIFNLFINTSADVLVLRLRYPGNYSEYRSIIYSAKPDVETLYTGSLLTSNVGYSLFVQFFPVVLLYLVNILLAKPRSSGALEFVLARPITRLDLYLTRYLAGVLTVAIVSALFLLGINIANKMLVGITLDAYSITMLYLGLVAGLVSFYSLCYMIASIARSGLYLAIAIALYLLFAMFWSLVVLAISYAIGGGLAGIGEVTYKLSYLNPLAPASTFAPYYVQKHYNIAILLGTSGEDLINPVLAILSLTTWIIATFVIGYLRFRKINLTS